MRGGICARADLVSALWVINTDRDISLNIVLHIALRNQTLNFIDKSMGGKCLMFIYSQKGYF